MSQTRPGPGAVQVAVVQSSPGLDRAQNLRDALDAVGQAAGQGAQLVVLPEYAGMYSSRGIGGDQAEPLDGPFVTGLAAAAAEHGIHLALGAVVPAQDDARAVNVAVLLAPDGRVAHRYRKVHLYDAYGFQESALLQPGPAFTATDDDAAPVPVGGLRLGVLVCYDLRFPELARVRVDAGADVLVIGAAWSAGEHKLDHLRVLARARAIENTCYVVLASQFGPGRVGHSMVVDPDGVVLAEASGDRPEVLSAWLDPAVVAAARERNPSLANRRYAVVPSAVVPSAVVPSGVVPSSDGGPE